MTDLAAAIDGFAAELSPCTDSLARLKTLSAEADAVRDKACDKLRLKEKRLQELQKQLDKSASAGSVSILELELMQQRLDELRVSLHELEAAQPATGSLFVRLFLGRVNVKVASPKDRLKLRDEYDKFKSRTNWGFILLPLLWLLEQRYLKNIFAYTEWIYSLTHVWLMYVYISLALREYILRANGSRMLAWFSWHHKLAALISVLMLTYPSDSTTMPGFLRTFSWYFLYQGLVQMAQSRYQKSRHYALRSLGKVSSMDVVGTEGLREFNMGLWFIVVLVLVAQAWQLVNGVNLFMVLVTKLNPLQPWWHFREELQCAALGAIFTVLGVGNFVTTVGTLLDKGKRERQRKRVTTARLPADVSLAQALRTIPQQAPLGGAGATPAAAAPAATDNKKDA